MGKIIFLDFDGTITKTDTCIAMDKAFAGDDWEKINKLWVEKKLSTMECANLTFKSYNADMDDVKRLLETIEIDDYFKDFLNYCREKGYGVYILSDGYDLNIESILKRYNIDIPYYSNKLVYDGCFTMQCPYKSQSCERCGTCKLELMESIKKEGDQAIYIGDGYSDTCPAAKADIVFAKGVLYKFCKDNGIPAVYFDNFKDIMESKLI